MGLLSTIIERVSDNPVLFIFLRGLLENDFKAIRAVIGRELELGNGRRTLDLGCGPGAFSDLFEGDDYVGADAIMRLMTGITAEAQFENRPHAVLADDEHVVVLVNGTFTRGEKRYEGDTVFVFHVDDGAVTEAWSIPSDPYALDAFWED